jgi:hypothetical protein
MIYDRISAFTIDINRQPGCHGFIYRERLVVYVVCYKPACTYTLFVGLVLYLILALSDPFQRGTGVDSTTFEYLVGKKRAKLGQS